MFKVEPKQNLDRKGPGGIDAIPTMRRRVSRLRKGLFHAHPAHSNRPWRRLHHAVCAARLAACGAHRRRYPVRPEPWRRWRSTVGAPPTWRGWLIGVRRLKPGRPPHVVGSPSGNRPGRDQRRGAIGGERTPSADRSINVGATPQRAVGGGAPMACDSATDHLLVPRSADGAARHTPPQYQSDGDSSRRMRRRSHHDDGIGHL